MNIATQTEPIERCDQGVQCDLDHSVCPTDIKDFKILRFRRARASNFIPGTGRFKKGSYFQTRRHFVNDVANFGYVNVQTQYNKNYLEGGYIRIIWARKRTLSDAELFIEEQKKKIKIIDDKILKISQQLEIKKPAVQTPSFSVIPELPLPEIKLLDDMELEELLDQEFDDCNIFFYLYCNLSIIVINVLDT